MRCNVFLLSLGGWGLGGPNNQYTLPKTNMEPLFFFGGKGGRGCVGYLLVLESRNHSAPAFT